MTIQINNMPEYEAARARYDGAITAARAASDQIAEAQAEAQWARDQADLYRVSAERATAAAALDSARAQARSTYPLAPEASYAAITDPTQLLAAARSTHEAVASARTATPPQAGAPATPPSWPTPPAGAPAPPPPPENPLDDPATYRATLGRAINGPKTSERQAWENPDREAIVDYAIDNLQRHGLQTVHVARPHDDQRKRRVEW